MSLTNPPPEVTAFRDMLLACSGVTTTLGIDTTKIHYPTATIDPDAGTASALPLFVLGSVPGVRTQYATQTLGLPSGDIVATLYASGSSAGALATVLRTIAGQLMALSTGLAITTIAIDDPSDPTPGMREDDPITCCTMTISHGIQP
jgi:hypothetical protein